MFNHGDVKVGDSLFQVQLVDAPTGTKSFKAQVCEFLVLRWGKRFATLRKLPTGRVTDKAINIQHAYSRTPEQAFDEALSSINAERERCYARGLELVKDADLVSKARDAFKKGLKK